jgi:hypothetical protein
MASRVPLTIGAALAANAFSVNRHFSELTDCSRGGDERLNAGDPWILQAGGKGGQTGGGLVYGDGKSDPPPDFVNFQDPRAIASRQGRTRLPCFC